LIEEWGWKRYGWKHHENRITRLYQAYILPKRWGIDKRKAHLSSLICSGLHTREKALETLKEKPWDYPELAEDYFLFLKNLDLPTMNSFKAYMDKPKRSHLDYPNNRGRVNLLRLIRRVIGR